ncbi:MAG TPA: transposase [Gemmatimonadaceae bacterium]|nr:transposase [Gemmatimonadaceae bacterium]
MVEASLRPPEERMPRMPRYACPGQPQHVVQRGNNRCAMFVADSDYLLYRDCLLRACQRYGCAIHAYVFMTNHVHLLATPRDTSGLGKMMQSVGRRYVQIFNSQYDRTGTLWEGRYKAVVIDSERYLFTCYRYIELNPVRAGMTAHPAQHRWSSHRANALGQSDALLTPHDAYQALGGDPRSRQAAYSALYADCIDDETLRDIRSATNKGWALGSDHFRDMVSRDSGRRASPLRRGPRGKKPQKGSESNCDVEGLAADQNL